MNIYDCPAKAYLRFICPQFTKNCTPRNGIIAALNKSCCKPRILSSHRLKLRQFTQSSGFIVGKSFSNNSHLFIFIQILYSADFPELHTHSYCIREKTNLLSICCLCSFFVVRLHTENPSQKISNFDKLLNDSCFF